MTAPHVPSDQTAIRAADDNRTVQAHRALDEAVAWLKRKPSWAALECVQDRALAVFLDRVRVLEGHHPNPLNERAKGEISARLSTAPLANPSPITPAPNGDRLPVPKVPRYRDEADYR